MQTIWWIRRVTNRTLRYTNSISRLRRLQVTGKTFFITCNLLPVRTQLTEADFEALASAVVKSNRALHLKPCGFSRSLARPVPGTPNDANEMEEPQGYKSNPALHLKPCGFSRSLARPVPGTPNDANEMEEPQGYKSNPALHLKPCGFSRFWPTPGLRKPNDANEMEEPQG